MGIEGIKEECVCGVVDNEERYCQIGEKDYKGNQKTVGPRIAKNLEIIILRGYFDSP